MHGQSMVIAHHLIWTAYGTWLPNDPRGSGSHTIAAPLLAELGQLHYGRKKVQPSGRVIHEFYHRAEERLLFPVIRFDRQQFEMIADAFTDAVKKHRYTCYACAIMPDHVHMVIRKHRHLAEDMIDNLQDASRLTSASSVESRFSTSASIPPNHPVWTLGGWKRFLDSTSKVRDVIEYVENNPLEAGLPPQHWSFVTPYDNWPFHRRPKSPPPRHC